MKELGFKMEQRYMGIDIGGTTTKFGVFTKEGRLLDKWSVPTDISENGKHIIPKIYREIKVFTESKGRISGAGLGIPGPVTQEGFVENCVNLGWRDVNPERELAGLLGDVLVAGGNDANVAALGEAWKGAGAGCENIFMVTLGTGVGGGAVVNGEIVNGMQGLSGEIGHIPVNEKETEKCNCGNCGCLDQIASATGIVRYTRRLLRESSRESCLEDRDGLTAAEITAAAASGDAIGTEGLAYSMTCLGKSLAIVSHIIDPEMFIIGGGVSAAGEMLIPMIQEGYDRHIYLKKSHAAIRLAKLGGDAGIYGAARLAMQKGENL